MGARRTTAKRGTTMINRIKEHLPEEYQHHAPATTFAQASAMFKQGVEAAAELIARYPGVSLMSAVFLGATLAWWIKRK
jgi:hypothetical protein